MYHPVTQSPQEDILSEEPHFQLARKTKRWLAAFVDYIIVGVLFFIAVYAFGDAVVQADGSTSYHLSGMPGFLGMFIPWFLVLPLIEIINNGQTLGKALFKIRTADLNGSKAGGSAILARHLFDILDYLPFFGIVGILVASYNSRKQRIGDLVAKTMVIDA